MSATAACSSAQRAVAWLPRLLIVLCALLMAACGTPLTTLDSATLKRANLRELQPDEYLAERADIAATYRKKLDIRFLILGSKSYILEPAHYIVDISAIFDGAFERRQSPFIPKRCLRLLADIRGQSKRAYLIDGGCRYAVDPGVSRRVNDDNAYVLSIFDVGVRDAATAERVAVPAKP